MNPPTTEIHPFIQKAVRKLNVDKSVMTFEMTKASPTVGYSNAPKLTFISCYEGRVRQGTLNGKGLSGIITDSLLNPSC